MDAELLELCQQTITRYAFISYDDHNDFSWQTDVTNASVVLINLVGVVLQPNIVVGTVVVTDTTPDDPVIYVIDDDYTVDYITGEIVRTADSSITSGESLLVSYSWQTITTFKARVEYKNTLVRNKLGQELVSTCCIYCDGTVDIEERDMIEVPGSSVQSPEIFVIVCNPDENGAIDHKVIYTK